MLKWQLLIIAVGALLIYLSHKGFKQIRYECGKRRKAAIEKAEAIEKTRMAEYERKLFDRMRAEGFLHDPALSRPYLNSRQSKVWATRDDLMELVERLNIGQRQLKAQSERIRLLERAGRESQPVIVEV